MQIVIIGTGNVAQVLGKMLVRANHTIIQVVGRNRQTVAECAAVVGAEPVTGFSSISNTADVCIIAVSDTALPQVANQIHLPQTLILHTSGAVSINVLNKHIKFGVLYPLQSLRKELPYLPEIPFFIDGCNDDVIVSIRTLAQTISADVRYANDEQRLKLHVAAVLCSNFTNHLYALANEFCNKEDLPFNLLFPLIIETAQRMQFAPPATLQTGPAIRKDEPVIQKHLQLLQAYPSLAEIYTVLTRSIQDSSINNEQQE